MARVTGPESGSRLAYGILAGGALAATVGDTATVYSDAAGTILADILTTGGSPIAGSQVTVGADSQLPLFQFPDGVDTVYVKVNGGPVTAIYTRVQGGGGGSVTSVNGHTGVVVLAASDVGADASGAAAAAQAASQPLDPTLTALAGLNSTAGLVAETAADTFTKRTLTGSSEISVSNGDGAAGNPTVSTQSATPTASAVGDGSVSGTIATHKHAREAFGTPGSSAIGDAAAAGSAVTVAHSDHVHGREALGGAPGNSAVGDTATAGTGTTNARVDHRHGREAFGNVTALAGYNTASANGSASTVSHSDHNHGAPAIAASDIASGVISGNRLPLITTPNLISGAWYMIPGQGGTGTITPANNTALMMCLVPLRDCTLSGLACEITTNDSTGVIRFGLASDSGGLPGSWLNDFGTVVATSIAIVQPASTPSVALTAGTRYWIGIVPQSLTAGLALRNRSTCDPNVAATPTSTSTPGALNTLRNCYTATGVSGALSGAITVAAVGSGPVVEARLT